jgi:hypothetical protein
MGDALAGRRIVVPETRELDVFARMLEQHGAITIRCPMVAMTDVPDAAPVVAWLRPRARSRRTELARLAPDVILVNGTEASSILITSLSVTRADSTPKIDFLITPYPMTSSPHPPDASSCVGAW